MLECKKEEAFQGMTTSKMQPGRRSEWKRMILKMRWQNDKSPGSWKKQRS